MKQVILLTLYAASLHSAMQTYGLFLLAQLELNVVHYAVDHYQWFDQHEHYMLNQPHYLRLTYPHLDANNSRLAAVQMVVFACHFSAMPLALCIPPLMLEKHPPQIEQLELMRKAFYLFEVLDGIASGDNQTRLSEIEILQLLACLSSFLRHPVQQQSG
jgi:hypothetical protein